MLTTMNTYFMGELANKGILAVFDLNISEANIIFYLFNNQREFSISEIIESQRISKFTTSRAVKNLSISDSLNDIRKATICVFRILN